MSAEKKRFAGVDMGLLKRFIPYLKKTVWMALFSFVLMVLTNLAGILQPYFVKVGIDRDIARGDWPGLVRTSLWLGGIMLGGFLFQFLYNISIQLLGQRLLFDIRMDLLRKIFSFSHDYFDRTPVGKTLTNVTNDVESVRQFISEGVVTVLGELLKVVFILAAMLLVNVRLALLAFTTIPVFVLATLFFRKSIRTGYADVRRANARINTLLTESITGINEINLFNYQATIRELFTRANKEYLDAFLQVVRSYSLYFPVIELVTNAGMVLVLLYAHYQMGITIQVGEIFIFFAYIQMFFRPLRQLAEKFNLFQSAMAAAERIFGLMDMKSHMTESYRPVTEPVMVKGDITFHSVDFAYHEDQPVLKNISFRIEEGEKVALVGTTGSGKTTIIKLLNRLYDVSAGSITINGKDVRDYPLATLRRAITTVPQDVFLFTGSARNNISLYDPLISRGRVVDAARQVHADAFIRSLPRGYDENLLEEGRSLSSGQKQLLSFARAFVREAPIIVLDEVTANIDSGTESQIQEATQRLIADKTAIIIAHRMSTIKLVDRILVFHHGELVGQGSHSQLMRENGIYAQYYRMQSMLSR